MRIFPIINNVNKKAKTMSKKLSFNQALAITGTVAILTTLYIKRDEWKSVFEEISKDFKENKQQTPLQKRFNSQEAALNYAFDRITNHLNTENKEYSVHINNNKHKIISECAGSDSSVWNLAPIRMFTSKSFTYDFSYTDIHGHPPYENGATCTFSFTDFNSFVSQDICSESYVLNNERKFCRFKKTEKYKKPTDSELAQLKSDYDRMTRISKFKHKVILDSKSNVIFEILDEPSMHSFWERMCNRFGIEYITTYGTYGLYDDIYKNGYHEAFHQEYEINNNHVPIPKLNLFL